MIVRAQEMSQNANGLRFSILASGSSGNVTYVESDRSVADVDAILVTHEHKDHIHGVGVLSRKYNLPVYANKATWQAMDGMLGAIDPDNRRELEPDQLFTYGD